ncbi:MAG: hypothetical protein LBV57_02995 [Candidatus Symbiothrix sp.]|jgi:uncharacterized iron-regulated protein|nr:hypothetical protein [Candidatus Symbiothrix sp.]
MKELIKKSLLVLAVMGSVGGFTSCEEEIKDTVDRDEINVNAAVEACSELETLFGKIQYNEDDALLYKQILQSFVDSTIVPTYKSLAEAALEMRKANNDLKNNPTNETMEAASDAWMKARVAWEINEAFLFGPVGESALDVDGHIDSWPLELEGIKESIAKGGNISGQEAWNLDSEVIGFHVTEYLLYRDGKSRPVDDLTDGERNYLIAATDALVWDCVLAYVAWVGEENVSDEMKAIFNENPDVVAHLSDNSSYKNFAAKMKDASAYSGSFSAAVSQISDGAIDIAGEVGETKIAAPFTTGKVEEVESWYSWHSLDDYKNNIQSIKNAYLGGVDNDTRTIISLSKYVAQKNPKLDTAIQDRIEDCITKIAAIGAGGKSFYEVVRDHKNK